MAHRRRADGRDRRSIPAAQPFLHDHRIDGTPVLPGRHGHRGASPRSPRLLLPGWHVVGDRGRRASSRPFKFYRDEPRTLDAAGAAARRRRRQLVADCRLIGRRAAARPGRAAGDDALHRPRAPGARSAPAGAARPRRRRRRRRGVGRDDDLPRLLPRPRLPGARPRLARRTATSVGRLAARPAGRPRARRAADARSAPRLIELCFQTAGICGDRHDRPHGACRTHVDRVRGFARRRATPGRLCAVVTPARRTAASTPTWSTTPAACVVRLEGYRTVALPGARRRARRSRRSASRWPSRQ